MKVQESPLLPMNIDPALKNALELWIRSAADGINRARAAIVIACSDETTALTTGTAKVTFRMPYGMDLGEIRASLSTAQSTGSIFTVDVNNAGTSLLGTKVTIDNAEKTSTTAATSHTLNYGATSLLTDAEITIDIDQVGDGTAKGLKVTLIGTLA